MAAEFQEVGIRNSATLTAGDSQPIVAAGSLFRVNCTVAGNVTVDLEGGTSEVIAVLSGYYCFPFRVVRVKTTGTTATATYANLYV